MNRRLALLLALGSLLATGCRNPVDSGLGTLEIAFSTAGGASARTINADLETLIAGFDISGASPLGDEFIVSVEADVTTVTQSGLVDGPWIVVVHAFNEARHVILTGSTSIYLAMGSTAIAEVVLTYPVGSGNLSFTIEWPSDLLSNPNVSALLAPAGGEFELDPPEFEIDGVGGTASYGTELQAGYYIFDVLLRETEDIVWGTTYAVRIHSGAGSTESVVLTAGDLNLPATGDPDP